MIKLTAPFTDIGDNPLYEEEDPFKQEDPFREEVTVSQRRREPGALYCQADSCPNTIRVLSHKGRPQRYCSSACKQKTYRKRKKDLNAT